MKPGLILAAAMITSLSGAAAAQSDKTDATPAESKNAETAAAPEAEPSADDKVVCRTERITGTRSRVNRICMTQREWDDLAEQTRRSLEDHSRASGRYEPPKNSPIG